jgi:hypothetical protein
MPGVTVAPRNRETFSAAIGLIGCGRSDRVLVKKGILNECSHSPEMPANHVAVRQIVARPGAKLSPNRSRCSRISGARMPARG